MISDSSYNNFWTSKKVLVTGGSGFIGSNFIHILSKMGASVICTYREKNQNAFNKLDVPTNIKFEKVDLLNFKDLVKVVRNVDTVINCAAMDGNAKFKTSHGTQMMDVNIRITSNILNLAKEEGIKNVVLMSSAEIYPNQTNPLVEEDDQKEYDDNDTSGYVLSKRYSEILGELYEYKYGINVFLPRPTNVYGPRDHFNDKVVRVIPSIINKIFSNQYNIY